MNLSGLIIGRDDHYITVKFCGVELGKFHEISDDYAHTHADELAKYFTAAWFKEGRDRLPMNERVEQCKNEAYSKL